MDKDETEKSRKILFDYFDKLQKISEEQLTKILEIRERLRAKFFKTEDLDSMKEFFEEKMTEIKILSEEIIKSLENGEKTTYVKDFEKTMETRSNALKNSLLSFLGSAKENMPEIPSSIKSIDTRDFFAKMPNFSEIIKLLTISLSKILVSKKPTNSNEQETPEGIVKKSSVPKQ